MLAHHYACSTNWNFTDRGIYFHEYYDVDQDPFQMHNLYNTLVGLLSLRGCLSLKFVAHCLAFRMLVISSTCTRTCKWHGPVKAVLAKPHQLTTCTRLALPNAHGHCSDQVVLMIRPCGSRTRTVGSAVAYARARRQGSLTALASCTGIKRVAVVERLNESACGLYVN